MTKLMFNNQQPPFVSKYCSLPLSHSLYERKKYEVKRDKFGQRERDWNEKKQWKKKKESNKPVQEV